MPFPDTRHSLIRRLADGGSENDWEDFVSDYWRPIRRFAQRSGKLEFNDAEDVTGVTFEMLFGGDLLGQWFSNRSSRLRQFLCRVVLNLLDNREWVEKNRRRLLRDHRPLTDAKVGEDWISSEEVDFFYEEWVREIVPSAVQRLCTDLHSDGKGDRFRVLYGRLCEQRTFRDIARVLDLTESTTQRYFGEARDRLSMHLKALVRRDVRRYCAVDDWGEEFETEWVRLGAYLKQHKGVEEVIRLTYDETGADIDTAGVASPVQKRTIDRLRQLLADNSQETSSDAEES